MWEKISLVKLKVAEVYNKKHGGGMIKFKKYSFMENDHHIDD